PSVLSAHLAVLSSCSRFLLIPPPPSHLIHQGNSQNLPRAATASVEGKEGLVRPSYAQSTLSSIKRGLRAQRLSGERAHKVGEVPTPHTHTHSLSLSLFPHCFSLSLALSPS